MTTELRHRYAHTNGIRMHYVEQGDGPLVLLCHRWPESWYSWRHQIPVLAGAGFRVVAPDQRGYGDTDAPDEVEAYDIINLVADLVGLVQALGEDRAFLVGHDWGAIVAAPAALLRPDMFRALGLLSVPYLPRQKPDGADRDRGDDMTEATLEDSEVLAAAIDAKSAGRRTMLTAPSCRRSAPGFRRRWDWLWAVWVALFSQETPVQEAGGTYLPP
jgi:pimeloyl-ACP methyl ester carboxylesterase